MDGSCSVDSESCRHRMASYKKEGQKTNRNMSFTTTILLSVPVTWHYSPCTAARVTVLRPKM